MQSIFRMPSDDMPPNGCEEGAILCYQEETLCIV